MIFLFKKILDIAINFIFNRNPNLSITRRELKKLFSFATSQTRFIFNSKFCNQIDGGAFGSPLAPVLANIFMGFHDSKWLNEYNFNKPKFYLTFVDEILAAFDNEQDSLNFLNFLNNRHPNIKFRLNLILKNAYPPFLIEKIIKKYHDYKFSNNQNQLRDQADVHYFKLPYIGNPSHHVKIKLLKLCKEFCRENFNIKLVFNSFKIKSLRKPNLNARQSHLALALLL